MNRTSSGRPWHLWLVGLLSLAWNGFGGYDYYMTQTENQAYLQSITEPYGMSLADLLTYFESFPIWVEAAWAVGVWLSVAGAVLLLMRSGFAFYAFVISLFGQLATVVWTVQNPMAGVSDSAASYGMTAFVTVLLLFQIWYSRKMAQRGVLG